MDGQELDLGVLLLWSVYAGHIWWPILHAKQTKVSTKFRISSSVAYPQHIFLVFQLLVRVSKSRMFCSCVVRNAQAHDGGDLHIFIHVAIFCLLIHEKKGYVC